jgi:hypothetical protein
MIGRAWSAPPAGQRTQGSGPVAMEQDDLDPLNDLEDEDEASTTLVRRLRAQLKEQGRQLKRALEDGKQIGRDERDRELAWERRPGTTSDSFARNEMERTEHERQAIMATDGVQLIFADAAGVQWWRDSHGSLELWKRPDR